MKSSNPATSKANRALRYRLRLDRARSNNDAVRDFAIGAGSTSVNTFAGLFAYAFVLLVAFALVGIGIGVCICVYIGIRSRLEN